MMLTALIAVSLTALALGEPITGEQDNGDKVPIDVSVKDGYLVAIIGQPVIRKKHFRQSVNLYDFEKHLEARKLLDEHTCYIRTVTATFNQAKRVLNAAKAKPGRSITVTEEWNIPGKVIPATELKETVGLHIAQFCFGYKVFWQHEIPKSQDKRDFYVNHNGLNYGFDNGLSVYVGGSLSPPTVSVGLSFSF